MNKSTQQNILIHQFSDPCATNSKALELPLCGLESYPIEIALNSVEVHMHILNCNFSLLKKEFRIVLHFEPNHDPSSFIFKFSG